MPTTLTLLFTDIVDSTALNTRLGDAAMASVWAQHDRGSRHLLQQWRGREIDRSDGFLALFDAPGDAAAFAQAYHRMLAALPVPLQARAGLHTGPLDLRQNTAADMALGAKPLELVGIGKAVGARLMALAQGGQTLCSAASAGALAQAGWRCCRHGHWRMKGLPEPLEVHEVGDDSTPFTPPPDAPKAQRVLWHNGQWVSGEQVPHNLPAERDSFVGRAQDLLGLSQRFDAGARLVTLHGPGGMGKTRLALRYAWAWRGSFPGGLWFCDLAQARSLDGVLQAVASGLDVPLGSDPAAQLGRAIAGRGHCLVILDNFEQITGHAYETLGRWLDAAPVACFLVTSREVLGVAGEHQLELEPLAGDAGATLFHSRALAAHAGYRRNDAGDAAVLDLVALLDGLPLAIELAAARVRVLPPHALRAQMHDRFRVLIGGRGRPDRHATLQATLAWSWDLLSAVERSALAQATVFEGSFDLAAAEAVLMLPSGTGGVWVVDVVQSLMAKSLLRVLPTGRFALLRSVREFAARGLAEDAASADPSTPMLAAVRQRHGVHYAGIPEAGATVHAGAELDNLVVACLHAVSLCDGALASASLLRAWLALRLTGPFGAALDLAAQVRPLTLHDGRLSANVDAVEALAQQGMGKHRDAIPSLRRGIAALHDCPDAALLTAMLHCALAESLSAVGEGRDAQQMLRVALEHAQRAGHAGMLCWVMNNQGLQAKQRDDVAAASAHFEDALRVAEAAGDLRWQGGLLGNLGALHFGAGRLAEARQAYTQALALASDSGDRRWAGNSHCNLGLVLLELGEAESAEQAFTTALQIARALGHRQLELTAQCNLGLAAQRRGDAEAACVRLHAAVQGAVQLQNARMEAAFRGYLGAALADTGRVDEARECLRATLTHPGLAGDAQQRALVLCSLAQAEHRAGDTVAARSALEEAQELAGADAQAWPFELGRQLRDTVAALRLLRPS